MDLDAKIQYRLLCLMNEECYDSEEGSWQFRSGGYCCTCTAAAMKIAESFSGKVFGFSSIENPNSLFASRGIEGHDFAIIAERWLVDYWAYRVAKIVEKPIFDLCDAGDELEINRIYGSANNWTEVVWTRSKCNLEIC